MAIISRTLSGSRAQHALKGTQAKGIGTKLQIHVRVKIEVVMLVCAMSKIESLDLGGMIKE